QTIANNFSILQKGTISTCSVPGAGPFRSYDPSNAAANGMVGACNSQLVVNGSFVANQVYMARTFGTVSDSANPGEVFNYSPETWLSGSSLPNSQAGSYQSVVGLPPVL